MQLESLEDQLRLESLSKRQLEEKMESMRDSYEQQLKQKDEERQQVIDSQPTSAAAMRSASASPGEDVLMRRRLRGQCAST